MFLLKKSERSTFWFLKELLSRYSKVHLKRRFFQKKFPKNKKPSVSKGLLRKNKDE